MHYVCTISKKIIFVYFNIAFLKAVCPGGTGQVYFLSCLKYTFMSHIPFHNLHEK